MTPQLPGGGDPLTSRNVGLSDNGSGNRERTTLKERRFELENATRGGKGEGKGEGEEKKRNEKGSDGFSLMLQAGLLLPELQNDLVFRFESPVRKLSPLSKAASHAIIIILGLLH